MVFNSLPFVLLLAVGFLAWIAAGTRARRWILLVLSYVFYAGWDPRYVPLLVFSTVLDFAVARALERTESEGRRKALLALSLTGNLGLLFYYKYWIFFLSTLGLAGAANAAASHAVPAGLSFYTFQTLGYAIDVYRRRLPASRSLLEFAVFVSFFPHLMAGPIMRAHDLLPQLRRQRTPSPDDVIRGVELFAVGMVKKVLVADNLGLVVDAVFADHRRWSGLSLGLTGVLFWAQIYCDFSGYSTMAVGLGRMFGFELPENFDYPLLATDPLDYRRRWHMTMSEWFRDNVFHPLGGTRRGPLRVGVNLMIVWALFGLWHGAAWTFVAWGLYNGLIQAVNRERLRRGLSPPDFPGKALLGWLVTFGLVVPSSIVFRARTLREGADIARRMVTLEGGVSAPIAWWIVVALLFAAQLVARRWYDERLLVRLRWPGRIAVLAALTALILVGSAGRRPFVYFQF